MKILTTYMKNLLLLTVFVLFQVALFSQSSLYSIKVNWSPNERFLANVDPSTGTLNVLSSSSLFDNYEPNGGSTIDPYNNIMYLRISIPDNRLLGIDLATGNIVSNPILSNPDDIHQLNFNCADSSLYSIKVNWSPNERFLAKVDPATGTVNVLSTSSLFDNYEPNGGSTIDPYNNLMYLRISIPDNRLLGIDLSSGNVVSNPILSNPDDLHQLNYNWKCKTSTDFYYQNTCLDSSTSFFTSQCSNQIEWNFGDTSSGINNTSNLLNPKHLYTDTGYFNVTLKTSNCYGTDSLVKVIHISSDNHQTALGNDTTLCNGTTLLLDASTPNATYIWQDNSTDSILNITQTGTYWVQVSRCHTSDTVNVTFTPLPLPVIGNDTTLCEGELLLLDATTTNASYLWQDNSTNPIFNVTQQGTYWTEVTNTCGSKSDTIIVNYNPLPNVSLSSFNSDTLCENASPTTLPLGIPTGGNYSGNGVGSGNFNPSTAGIGTHDIIYTYTDGNSCINSDTTIITVDICIGIDNINSDSGIIIYPNPSTGQFTIEKPNDLNKEVQVKLLDATSKLILEKIIPIGDQKVEMDIRNYSKGIYYLQLIVDDEIFIKQLLKN
jgi:PKD repeat protein